MKNVKIQTIVCPTKFGETGAVVSVAYYDHDILILSPVYYLRTYFYTSFLVSKAPNGSKINQMTINIGPLGD